jgi:hypothetical protein
VPICVACSGIFQMTTQNDGKAINFKLNVVFFDKNLFVFDAIWLSNNLCERCATIGLIYFFLQ